ncbi:MAG: 3',5'-cyclic-nucleotide phosphodiesterase [bacterium]
MKIKVLGCYGGEVPGKYISGFLLGEDTLVDAGTIGLNLELKAQRKLRNILISHPHLDHICALPFLGGNVLSNKSESLKIVGAKFSLEAIKKYIMNGTVWPDFTKIKNQAGAPVFSYMTISYLKWVTIGKYKIKAIPVNHTVPTNGYLIGEGDSYMLYSGDTKTTEAIWQEGKKLGTKLKAIFVETSFPNERADLADKTGHLTPAVLEAQLKKIGDKAKPKIFIYHIKPEYQQQVEKELKKIKGFDLTLVKQGNTYTI